MSERNIALLRTDIDIVRAHMWREPEFNACGVKAGEAAFHHSLKRLLSFVESHLPTDTQDTSTNAIQEDA